MICSLRSSVLLFEKNARPFILKELEILASVVGISIEEKVSIRVNGTGIRVSDYKLDELEKKLKETGSDLVLVQPDLPPSEKIAIMKKTKADVLDRTALLLEVFEVNAGSREAKLQIEVAKYKHEIPLLREILNRSKRGELPGFMAGGTYAIDRYYKQVRKSVARARRELEEIRKRRAVLRERRKKVGLPSVAIVGYANAGKTTLFNALTGNNKAVGPTPFTTLSPKTSRHLSLPMLLVDTVGFVLNVPPEIVEAFYGTLEEIKEADALIFALDIGEEEDVLEEQMKQAAETFSNLDSIYKPVVIAANKIDSVIEGDLERKAELIAARASKIFPKYLGTHLISALRRMGIEEVEEAVWLALNQRQECLG
ncbi:MAG: GTPase [Fervidicoccaceae archaeon]|nr:MAG: GTPase HflX [Fervidicoccus sp.]